LNEVSVQIAIADGQASLRARICVDCVATGWIDTPFNQPYWTPVGDTDDSHAALEPRIPFGAQGAPADVAAAIVFLASPAASYISGQTLIVAGGLPAS
jgi:NAD(P)-dependent dehydrogenase (short-subunit alcohol dehydrogenase family)